jgi:beta-lactamase regulating signal transducer with metallopeptidase domain
MNLLIELTLRGSVAALAVLVFDRSLAGRIGGPSRRLLWCLVPLAFLVPLHLPVFSALGRLPPVVASAFKAPMLLSPAVSVAGSAAVRNLSLVTGVWLLGTLSYAALVLIQTARASRRWSRERLSTDHSLLELLEDCKAETGVTVPIGLVVSGSVPSPAIMGWLRPRILIPASLATSARDDLRPILLHELAHFRWFDVPFNWLLTLVRTLHWFNPLAHLGAVAWAHFREEAADEAVIRLMRDDTGRAYGDALVRALRQCRPASVPFGAMAIVESVHHLKRRITMIKRYHDKSPRILLAGFASIVLAAVVCSISVRAADTAPADPKAAALASAQTWLLGIDGGQYKQSWKDASTAFQKQVTAEQWEEMLKSAREPLGKCDQRKEVSAALQKDPPTPNGVLKGEFVILQFASSFENLKSAGETVTFTKEEDGSWKAVGYYIHPR